MNVSLCDRPTDIYVVATLGNRFIRDFAEMIVAELKQMDLYAEVVADGDPRIRQTKAIILLGEVGIFPASFDILKSEGGNAPLSILWHTEQLPPMGLSGQAEIIAERLVRYCDKTSGLFRGKASSMLPFKNAMRDLVMNHLARKLRNEIQNIVGSLNDYDLHVRGLLDIFRPYISLKQLSAANLPSYIFVTTSGRQEFFDSKNIKSYLLPVGSHRGWGYVLEKQRDIDVVFLGYMGSGKRQRTNRLRIITETAAKLEHHGHHVKIIEHSCFGEGRAELLNRTKIVLDVARVPWDLPGMRLMMSMACGALVVTSYMGNPYPFIDGKHLVQSPSEQLANRILYYLEHEDRRSKIAISAKQHLETMTLADQLKTMMQITGFANVISQESKHV
jgi:hypothetical protein